MNRDRNFSLPLLLRNILRQNGEVCPQTWELVNPDSKVSAEENKLGRGSPGVLPASQNDWDSKGSLEVSDPSVLLQVRLT